MRSCTAGSCASTSWRLGRSARMRHSAPGGVRFLFDCGTFSDERLKMITLQAEEIDEYRLAEMDQALVLRSGPLRRRMSKVASAKRCLYLENGRRVRGVSR